eukprot:5521741-Amphidinium_carterae.1
MASSSRPISFPWPTIIIVPSQVAMVDEAHYVKSASSFPGLGCASASAWPSWPCAVVACHHHCALRGGNR